MPDNGQATSENTARIEAIVSKITAIELSMLKLTETIVRFAVIEERQMTDRQSQDRAFRLIEETRADALRRHERDEARIAALERAAPMHAQTTGWVMGGVWACVVVVAMFAGKQVGLL